MSEIVELGIHHCRKGEWARGLSYLRQVAEDPRPHGELPSVFYSYLGFGVAKLEKRVQEGLSLCHHALKREFYQADNYLNLAQTQLLANDRKGAVATLDKGLRLLPDEPRLLALRESLGIRRRPAVKYLDRSNPVNQVIGRVRDAVAGKKSAAPEKPTIRLARRAAEEL